MIQINLDVLEQLEEIKKIHLGSVIQYDYNAFTEDFKSTWLCKMEICNYNLKTKTIYIYE